MQGAGGIGKFLIHSLQFAMIDNFVCLMQDAQTATTLAEKHKQILISKYRKHNSVTETVDLSPSQFPTIAYTEANGTSVNSSNPVTEWSATKASSNGSSSQKLSFTTIASSIVTSELSTERLPTLVHSNSSLGLETTTTTSPDRPISSSAVGMPKVEHSNSANLAHASKSDSSISQKVNRLQENVERNSLADLAETYKLLNEKESGSSTPEEEGVDGSLPKPATVSEQFRKQVFAAAGKELPAESDRPKRTDSPASVSSGSSASHAESPCNPEVEKPVVVAHRTVYNTGERDVCKFRLEARNVTKHVPPAPAKVTGSSHSTPTRTPPVDSNPLPKKSESMPNTPMPESFCKAEARQLEKIDKTKDLWQEASDKTTTSDKSKTWQAAIRPWGQKVQHFTNPEQLREESEFVDIVRPDEQGQSPENPIETHAQSISPWETETKRSITPSREGSLDPAGGIWTPRVSTSPVPPGVIRKPTKVDSPKVDAPLNVMPSIHSTQAVTAFPSMGSLIGPQTSVLTSDLLGSGIKLQQMDMNEPDMWTLDSNRPNPKEDPVLDTATIDVAESTKLEIERFDDEFCRENAKMVFDSWKRYPAFSSNPELLDKIVVDIKTDLEKSYSKRIQSPRPENQPIGSPFVSKGKAKTRNIAVECDIRPLVSDASINTDPYEPYREQLNVANQQVFLLQQRIQGEMDKNVQMSNITSTKIMCLQKEREDLFEKLKVSWNGYCVEFSF